MKTIIREEFLADPAAATRLAMEFETVGITRDGEVRSIISVPKYIPSIEEKKADFLDQIMIDVKLWHQKLIEPNGEINERDFTDNIYDWVESTVKAYGELKG